MFVWRRRGLVLVLGLAILLSACGGAKPAATTGKNPAASGGAGGSNAGAPAPGKPGELPTGPRVKWKHGVIKGLADLGWQKMAQAKGYFEKAGIDIEFVQVGNDQTILLALIAGELDSAEINASGMINAVETGAKLKVVGAFFPKMNQVLYVNQSINKLEDLKGKPLATSGLGTFPHTVISALLRKQGLNPDEMQWVQIGDVQANFLAVLSGKAFALVTNVDFVKQLETDKRAKVLMNVGDSLPEFIRFAFLTSDKVIETKREALVRMLSAYTMGVRYAADHIDEAVDLAVKESGYPKEAVQYTYDWTQKHNLLETNFYVDPKAVEFTQDLNMTLGRQKKKLPMEQVATWDIQKEVIAKIGEYKPKQ